MEDLFYRTKRSESRLLIELRAKRKILRKLLGVRLVKNVKDTSGTVSSIR